MSYELSTQEIINDIKTVYGIDVFPKEITVTKGFGRPTYVVDRGCQFTFLCRKANNGHTSIRRVQWY